MDWVLFFSIFSPLCCSVMTPPYRLPAGPLIIGYPNWDWCSESIISDVLNGVNVIIWFSIDLVSDEITSSPIIKRGPDFRCVANIVKQINDRGIHVSHLISVGGWNSPHIDASFSASEWWNVWKKWNSEIVAQPDLGFYGFHGIDWDLEGNDNPSSPFNHFTVPVLDLMGSISQLAKKDGYLVGIAPAQSYFDPSNPSFDRSLLHPPPWKPDFFYHANNPYAYVISKYAKTQIHSENEVNTFDLVSIQFYEGWSRANHEINDLRIPVGDYLLQVTKNLLNGWKIDFDSDPEIQYPSQIVKIEKDQLIIGLANGWAGPRPNKFLLMWPEELQKYYEMAKEIGSEPRGFMFWNLQEEGLLVDGKKFELAKGLKQFLK